MIAITGATGQLGRLVLTHLTGMTGEPVRALVRDPQKAEDLATGQVSVAEADFDRPDTLRPALDGVDRLLFISAPEFGKRAAQHEALIAAAKDANVRFIAYTSILNADTSDLLLAKDHQHTELALKQSGIPHSLLRASWYVENFEAAIGAGLHFGAISGVSGTGRYSAAGRNDLAEAAARVIADTAPVPQVFELAGRPAFSLEDLAGEVSRQSGKTIPFAPLSAAAYTDMLTGAGLPLPVAEILADADAGTARDQLFSSRSDLTDLLGRPTLTLADYVAKVLSKAEATAA